MERPIAEILTIGNEVLKGHVLNTNARFLGSELTQLGMAVRHQSSCQDEIAEIKKSLRLGFSRADLMILTGGLGPTPDDLTRDAIADYFGRPLRFSKSQYRLIESYYKKQHRKIPEIVKKEAQFPEGAVPLINRYGIALGFYMVTAGKIMAVLPGVPGELERMFEDLVKPILKKRYPGLSKKFGFVAKMTGISEPEVMRRLKDDFFKNEFEFGIYPDYAEVAIRIQTETRPVNRLLLAKVKKRLASFIYSFEEIPLREALGRIFAKRKKTLAVAESCTGGLLASEITKSGGASEYFRGGVVAYHNTAKSSMLRVDPLMIKRRGAVSPEVAKQLAEGARKVLNSDYGIGVTGIAGPGGGSKKKPVGLVYLAVASPGKTRVWEQKFWGERTQIQLKAAKKALQYLWQVLAQES